MILLIGTSFTGALSIMIGLDLFIRTGFTEVFACAMTGTIIVQDGSSVQMVFAILPPTKVPGPAWAIFVSIMVFAAFGSVVQQIPPAKKIPDPPKPRAAFAFWPWQPVIPPQPHIPRHKNWYAGEAGSGWRPRL